MATAPVTTSSWARVAGAAGVGGAEREGGPDPLPPGFDQVRGDIGQERISGANRSAERLFHPGQIVARGANSTVGAGKVAPGPVMQPRYAAAGTFSNPRLLSTGQRKSTPLGASRQDRSWTADYTLRKAPSPDSPADEGPSD